MLQDEGTRVGVWAALAAVSHRALLEWRRQHPRASFGELKAYARDIGARLPARTLGDLTAASPASDLAATTAVRGSSQAGRAACSARCVKDDP